VKIAFLASRKGYLKVMGSLIQASIQRGHEVVLVHDPGERKPGETVTAAGCSGSEQARVNAAAAAPIRASTWCLRDIMKKEECPVSYGRTVRAAIRGRPSCCARSQLAWYTSRAILSIFS